MLPVAIGALGRYNRHKNDKQYFKRMHPDYYKGIIAAMKNKQNIEIDPSYIKVALDEQQAKDQQYQENLERFGEIKVSTNKDTYQAGDVVIGVVSFKLKQNIFAKQLLLKVKGYQIVQLTNDEMNKKILNNLKYNQIQQSEGDEDVESYINTFVIYDHKFIIYEEEEKQLFIQNQNYVIPFEITLEDQQLPRSFQIIEKEISLITLYKISAIIPIEQSQVKTKENGLVKVDKLKHSQLFNMSEQPRMIKMKHLVSQFEGKFSTMKCCVQPQKPLSVSLFLDKNQQIVGQNIRGYYEIHINSPTLPFSSLQFKLIRFLKVKFPDGIDRKLKNIIKEYTIKINTNTLQKEKNKFIGFFDLTLPATMHPTITSQHVSLQYALICTPHKFNLFGKCVANKLIGEGRVYIYYPQEINNDFDEIPQEQLIMKHCQSSSSGQIEQNQNSSDNLDKKSQIKKLKLESGKLTKIDEIDELKEEIMF